MLKKLLKYDLISMYKYLIIFYFLSIIFAILTRITFSLEQTIIIKIISQICMGAMFAMLANAIVNTVIRNWVRFKETIYSDEGYLTHTLPVTKSDILSSKYIVAFINLLTTFIVVFISLFIVYYSKENIAMIKDFLASISGGIDISVSLFLTCIIFILFLEVYNGVVCGFLGIAIGYRNEDHKTLTSIIISFAIYLLSQLIVIALLYFYGLFNSEIKSIFTSATLANLNVIKVLLLFCIIAYTLIIIINRILIQKIFNKGVNVE